MNRFLFAVATAALLGCAPAPVLPSSSGSLAVSRDDALLYVADADHDRLTVLDARSGEVLRHVALPAGPERVAVSADDGTVYVTSRRARRVTRLDADGVVLGEAVVGAEPVGLSLSRDGRQLFVANSLQGTVSELDARTLEPRRELAVGGTPWAVAPHPDGDRLYVTDFLSARVRVLSRSRGGEVSSATLEQPPTAECQDGSADPRTPSQAADVVLSPDGDRAYVAHTQSRTGPSFTLAFAVAPALSTVDTSSGQTFREPEGPQVTPPDFPAPVLATDVDEQCRRGGRGNGMDAPSSLVADPLGEWIFVADHNSNAVAVVSATRRVDTRFESPQRGIYGVVRVGARPTGLAVSSDLKTAWVHNALDYTVSQVELRGDALVETRVLPFASSALAPDVERGRRLFYSAVDPRLSQPSLGGVSCSSCHPDGRTDGLSWVLPNALSSARTRAARNTPALWNLAQTAPYDWAGQQPDLASVTSHMVDEMGGDGLGRAELADVATFMATLSPPDNPHALPELDEARGRALFEQRCGSCHAGPALTDRLRHPVAGEQLDTPSLVGVFSTAPFLHDGSAPTLREALRHAGAPTSPLEPGDAELLEAWLRAR